jgi:putative sigma-54 modulation protein
MNDFPIPEDPPVTMTAENGWSASRSEDKADTIGRQFFLFFLGRAGVRLPINETIRRTMNSQNNHDIIVSGIHLDLTPALKNFVREKSGRLFRHAERIVRFRVELECDRNAAIGRQFKAKGHIEIYGPDMNAMVESQDCYQAISLLVGKLDRMLQRRHQLRRVKRNHPHRVELGAAIPKGF